MIWNWEYNRALLSYKLSVFLGFPYYVTLYWDQVKNKILSDYKKDTRKPFFVSIKKKEDCLFCRRTGYMGTIILGYSVIVRAFKVDLL